VPEVSAVCAATLVAELGTPQDYAHYRQVLKLAGMNLASRSSGQTVGRKWQSKRGRPALRRQLFLLAGRWCLPRGLYRADYLALKARNGGLGTKAVCTLARKLVPLLLRVMQTGEPFDPARWQANRRRPEVAA
jgi:transposase